jgi:hypothetical protein
MPQGTPHSILRHLMEENQLKQDDLVSVISSREILTPSPHHPLFLKPDLVLIVGALGSVVFLVVLHIISVGAKHSHRKSTVSAIGYCPNASPLLAQSKI